MDDFRWPHELKARDRPDPPPTPPRELKRDRILRVIREYGPCKTSYIARELRCTQQQVKWNMKELRRIGAVYQVARGVWAVSENPATASDAAGGTSTSNTSTAPRGARSASGYFVVRHYLE